MRALPFALIAVAAFATARPAEATFGRPLHAAPKAFEGTPLELDPSPNLTPRQVVDIQVGALGANGTWGENRGIELAFRFASPANKRVTGPLARFAGMIRAHGAYRKLLDVQDYDLGPLQMHEGSALIPVIVTARDGRQHGFVWVLGRQTEGENANCWMTDAVYPAPLAAVATQDI